jgi:peptidyl-prolyl cis-trans isomerase C
MYQFIPRAWLCLLTLVLHPAFADPLRADSDTVIASQGGMKVTLGDVDAFAKPMPVSDRAHFFDSPQRIQSLITNLLLRRQLAGDAREHGLDKELDASATGGSASDAALAAAELKRFQKDLPIPDFSELAHEEYVANPDTYEVGRTFDIRQILISKGLVSTVTRSDDDARALAEKVAAEVHANPDQFDALVEKYSDEPGKARDGGLMHDADRSAYDDTFRVAIRALHTPGEISPLIKTESGYHLVKLIARSEGTRQPFENVRDEVIASLKARYIEKSVRTHLDELRNRPLDADPERVASLRTRYRLDAPAAAPDAPPAKAAKAKSKARTASKS